MLTRYGADAVLVDVTISGLRGSEAQVLTRVAGNQALAGDGGAVAVLTAAVARSGDNANVQQVIARIADPATGSAERLAMLHGLDLGLPGGAGGRGGRGGGRGAVPAKPVSLPGEPAALVALAAGEGGETAALARRVASKLEWPGKPAPKVDVPPLTPAEQKRFTAGAELYKNVCLGCHQEDGRGKEKIAPSLVQSRYATGEPTAAMRILLAGKEGTIGLMPPLGGALNDEQIASVLTYVRREWGNTGSPVAADEVTEIRGLTKTRTRPWTDAELTQGRGGRGGRGQ
jgi:mono/diheme cytochrome c family protein